MIANPVGYGYDAANRLIGVGLGYTPELYAYDARNQRVGKQKANGSQEFYFYAVDRKKLGADSAIASTSGYPGMLIWGALNTNVYFGSKLISTVVPSGVTAVTTDRLGSSRQAGNYPAAATRCYSSMVRSWVPARRTTR